jgi:hypothetical protein
LRGYFFAVLAVQVCIGRAPHTGLPGIVARPMHTHPDCEQLCLRSEVFRAKKLSS